MINKALSVNFLDSIQKANAFYVILPSMYHFEPLLRTAWYTSTHKRHIDYTLTTASVLSFSNHRYDSGIKQTWTTKTQVYKK